MTLIVVDMVVGARQEARLGTGIFTTSQPPSGSTENATKNEQMSSERQLCGGKNLVDARAHWSESADWFETQRPKKRRNNETKLIPRLTFYHHCENNSIIRLISPHSPRSYIRIRKLIKNKSTLNH